MFDKWKSLVNRVCRTCGIAFAVQYQSIIRPHGGLYCSRSCNPRFRELAKKFTALEIGPKRAVVEVVCAGCGSTFSTRVKNIARGGGRYCSRSCNPSYAKRYSPIEKQRRYHLSRNYGLSVVAFERMRSSQKGRCAICRSLPDNPHGVLVVDHCHLSGQVRQLLCNNCNTAIGLLRDDPITATRLAAYLLRHDPICADLHLAIEILSELRKQMLLGAAAEVIVE